MECGAFLYRALDAGDQSQSGCLKMLDPNTMTCEKKIENTKTYIKRNKINIPQEIIC